MVYSRDYLLLSSQQLGSQTTLPTLRHAPLPLPLDWVLPLEAPLVPFVPLDTVDPLPAEVLVLAGVVDAALEAD